MLLLAYPRLLFAFLAASSHCRSTLSLKSTRTPRSFLQSCSPGSQSSGSLAVLHMSMVVWKLILVTDLSWLGLGFSGLDVTSCKNTQRKFCLLYWDILYHQLKRGTTWDWDQVLWRYISDGRTLYHSRRFLKIIAIQPEYESAVIKSCIVSTRGQMIHFAKVSPVLAGMQWLFRLFWVMHVTYCT